MSTEPIHPPHRPPPFDHERRLVLRIALALLTLLCAAGTVIVARDPHTVRGGAAVFAGCAAVFVLALGLLHWRRCPPAIPVALAVGGAGLLIVMRIAMVLGSEAVRSGELSAFNPIFAYVTIYLALIAVLLPPRLSVPAALAYWLLVALLTTALTRGMDLARTEAVPALLLFVWLAYPLLIALIAGAIRIVSRIHAQAVETALDLQLARSELAETNRKLEQRIAERTAELERERAALAAVLDNVSEGIIACDAAGRVVLVNPAARRLLGDPPPDGDLAAWGRRLSARPLPGRESEASPFTRALAGERVRDTELLITTPDGATHHLLVNAGPLPDGGVVASVRDVTEAMRQREALLQSNTALEQFAYAISHDLQAPLRTISGFAGLLARRHGEALDESAREYLQYVIEGCATMKAMIEGVLQISRLRARPLHRVRTDPAAAARQAIDNLRGTEGVDIAEIEITPMPAVDADPELLVLLMQNLIGNAVKFSEPPAKVTIGGRRDGSEVEIAVRDQGVGFDPSQAEELFRLFRRVGDPSRHPGHGIGLATCRLIAERLGGSILAHSDGPGRGATFTVRLPAAD